MSGVKGFKPEELEERLATDSEFRRDYLSAVKESERESMRENKRLREENRALTKERNALKRQVSTLKRAARSYMEAVEAKDEAQESGKRIALRLLQRSGEHRSKRARVTEADRFSDAMAQREFATERIEERGAALKSLIGGHP